MENVEMRPECRLFKEKATLCLAKPRLALDFLLHEKIPFITGITRNSIIN